jgi:hypothetical protein
MTLGEAILLVPPIDGNEKQIPNFPIPNKKQ